MEEKNNDKAMKGRAAFLAKYREANPDVGEDVQDDVLWDDVHRRHSSLEEEYGKMNAANSRLGELVASDPKLAAVLSMIAGDKPKSLPYSVGRIYGADFMDGDLDEFEAGYQDNLVSLAQSRQLQEEAQKNIEKSIAGIEKYAKSNGLSEEQFEALYRGIMDLADNLLLGKIPSDVIDLVYKGINYDQDVQEAADTGYVEGKNQKVHATMREKNAEPLPNIGNSGGRDKAVKGAAATKRKSFFDDLKEIPM